MARKYFTLITLDAETGIWSPQFGDYDREVVEAERDDYCTGSQQVKRKHTRIIVTSSRQKAINETVATINEVEATKRIRADIQNS